MCTILGESLDNLLSFSGISYVIYQVVGSLWYCLHMVLFTFCWWLSEAAICFNCGKYRQYISLYQTRKNTQFRFTLDKDIVRFAVIRWAILVWFLCVCYKMAKNIYMYVFCVIKAVGRKCLVGHSCHVGHFLQILWNSFKVKNSVQSNVEKLFY